MWKTFYLTWKWRVIFWRQVEDFIIYEWPKDLYEDQGYSFLDITDFYQPNKIMGTHKVVWKFWWMNMCSTSSTSPLYILLNEDVPMLIFLYRLAIIRRRPWLTHQASTFTLRGMRLFQCYCTIVWVMVASSQHLFYLTFVLMTFN